MSVQSLSFPEMDGKELRVGIIQSRWNELITTALADSCMLALEHHGVPAEQITRVTVPGSYELPTATKILMKQYQFDVVVCIGVLVKGETVHFEYIADAVSNGIMALNVEGEVPVIFGVLTCLTEEQAKERATGENNHGYLWGQAAVEMGLMNIQQKESY